MELEEILESPLDNKEIKPVNPKGKQPWIFFGRTDTEAEVPRLWPPDMKSQLTGKDPDAGKDWGKEEKATTGDETAGWHHRLNGHEFEQTLGDGEARAAVQGSTALDTTSRMNKGTLRKKATHHWERPGCHYFTNQVHQFKITLKRCSRPGVLTLEGHQDRLEGWVSGWVEHSMTRDYPRTSRTSPHCNLNPPLKGCKRTKQWKVFAISPLHMNLQVASFQRHELSLPCPITEVRVSGVHCQHVFILYTCAFAYFTV